RRRRFASEQFRQRGRVYDAPHDRIVGVGGRDEVLTGADVGQQRFGRFRIAQIAFGAELREGGTRFLQVALGDRTRAALGDEASEREVAERRLVAFAEQLEQR